MLRAYFDAGATQRGFRTFYMGGYIGRIDRWTTFNRQWRELLRRNDLKFFHMTDFEARQGPYRGWPDKKRLAVIRRVVELVGRTATLGVAAAIVTADYEALSKEDQRLVGNLYGICVAACIARVARNLHDAGINEPVAYVFELGDVGQGTVRRALDELLGRPGYREKYQVLSVNFEDKRGKPGLQIADLIAFETGKHVPRFVGLESRPIRKSLKGLLGKIHHDSVLFDSHELGRLLQERRREQL